MSGRREAVEYLTGVLVDHGMRRDIVGELAELVFAGQLSEDEQVSNFKETGLGSKVFNLISPIP
jgi:hypothetical protein